ncbi:MAG: ATP-dependent Clp protease adapter ClpS [Galactobacter sp.]
MTTVSIAPVAAPVSSPRQDTALKSRLERPYELLVWDDPVNLMSYVAYIFRSYFGYSASRAEELMLQVHHDGKAVVASGSRERIEADLVAMHGYGLQATLRQES